MKQLDLFAVRPGPAAIHILPAQSMLGELRAAAQSVLKVPPSRQHTQRRRCLNVFRELFADRGIPQAAIETAVGEFAVALEVEIRRQLVRAAIGGRGHGRA